MAAALGEKDGFPLGPQLFCLFAGARCGSPARGFQLPGRRHSYLYMYTNNLFYFVYMAYFLLHSTNS